MKLNLIIASVPYCRGSCLWRDAARCWSEESLAIFSKVQARELANDAIHNLIYCYRHMKRAITTHRDAENFLYELTAEFAIDTIEPKGNIIDQSIWFAYLSRS